MAPFGHFWEALRRFAAILDEDVRRVKQVSVYVLSNDDFIAVENFFNRRVEVGKTNNDAMNGGDVGTFARPFESSVCEVNSDAFAEEIFPHDTDAFALHDRICRQKRARNFGSVNEIGGFAVSSGYVIEFAVFVVVGKSERHILDLP